ncbi:protein of unknown function [Paenibacillus tianmuensis]|uniref:DUF4304 domain-containing protein n=1 Tax=Paenibacillus tianmuensis TaxID=624147 RepID=A0A1G4RKL6_9BACL|nr:DUF4304 domain-containing protein [Paenibacillus tianmuensis]SCW57492.1 protein of unknown function [Paenibacillus tianmuensis]
MIDTKVFKKLLKEHFEPVLRDCGFKGSGGKYRSAPTNHYIYTAVVQASKNGGSCCIELGIFLNFLPNTIGVYVPHSKVTPYDCEFRKRLSDHENSHDYWWDYGETESEAIKSIEHMRESFVRHGLLYFEQFQDFPSPLTSITLEDLEQGNQKVKALGSMTTDIRLALTISQVHLYVGNGSQAKLFAEWALKKIGNGIAGRALKPILKDIIEKAQDIK